VPGGHFSHWSVRLVKASHMRPTSPVSIRRFFFVSILAHLAHLQRIRTGAQLGQQAYEQFWLGFFEPRYPTAESLSRAACASDSSALSPSPTACRSLLLSPRVIRYITSHLATFFSSLRILHSLSGGGLSKRFHLHASPHVRRPFLALRPCGSINAPLLLHSSR
jgi:hypothetical protein